MDSVTQTQPELYEKLAPNKRNIRLLRLLPGQPEDPTIRCELHEWSLLDASGNYRALSYVWGSDVLNDEQVVYCNGVNVHVTLNLYSALHNLRDVTTVLTMWVDSLCINQGDEKERTRQVRMMREIYFNSKEVIIWLGSGGLERKKTDQADIRFCGDERDIPKIESHLGKLGKGELVSRENGQDIFGVFCMISMLGQGLLASKIWYLKDMKLAAPVIRGLFALLNEPWWSRIWVIQEAVVSTQAVVYYRNMSIPWKVFSRASYCYVTGRAIELLGPVASQTYGPALARFHRLVSEIDTTKRDWNTFEPSALLPLLRKFRNRYASDKRDKVFALIGLVNIWGEEPPLKPDYELRLSRVYWETTKHLIRSSKTLAVLSGTTSSETHINAGFPSWVTDWSYHPSLDETDRLTSQLLYNAAGSAMDGVSIHGQTLLEAKGYCVDRISTVQECNATLDGDLQARVAGWKLSLPWADNVVHPHGDSIRTAFWRTICGDVMYITEASTERARFRKAVDSDAAAFEDWYGSTESANRQISIIDGTWKEAISSEGQIIHKRRIDYKLAVECASKGRCFFITQQGRLGIGPPSVSPDDVVYILHGSRVPMILRHSGTSRTCRDKVTEKLIFSADDRRARVKAGSQNISGTGQSQEALRFSVCNETHGRCYKLIGDAYVHGIMDGHMIWEDASRTRLRKSESVYIV